MYLTNEAAPWEVLPTHITQDEKTAVDFTDIPKTVRENAAHIPAEHTKINFCEPNQGLTKEQATREAQRCLSCGCVDFYECELIRLANIYEADPNRWMGVKPHMPMAKQGAHLFRNPNKCIVCGLCIRICENLVGAAALSTTLRGLATEVATPSLSNDCIRCGNCVSVCPVGALTEAATPPFAAKEVLTQTTCGGCGNGCQIYLCTYAGQLRRVLPLPGGLLCEEGRFNWQQNNAKRIFHPLINGQEASLDEAISTIRSQVNNYAPEHIGIAISPLYTNEDIQAIMNYARKLNTPHIFTFSGEKSTISLKPKALPQQGFERQHANTRGLLENGVSIDTALYTALCHAGTIKALLLFGEDLPVWENPPFIIARQTAILTEGMSDTHVILPGTSFGEAIGHYTDGAGRVQSVNAAVASAFGLQNRDLIELL